MDGGAGVDYVDGGAGADTLLCNCHQEDYSGYGDILMGGEGDDTIYGTERDDVIFGGDGNDTIYGLGGNDQLYGEGGDDFLDGGDGDDYLDGGSDDDYLIGGSGHDAHLGGGQTADAVGDRPTFANFLYRYRGEDREVFVSGNIVDDESVAGLPVTYSGIAQGTIQLSETGAFRYIIAVPELGNGWLYLDFTDAEGLQAQRMTMALT